MFGLEKTLLNDSASLEVRIPFANGLNSDQLVDGVNENLQATEFGNIGLALKRMLFGSANFGVSAGVGMVLPTADDVPFFDDFDTIGNRLFRPIISDTPLGRLQDQTLLFLDCSTGYWLFRNPRARISGVAPMLELHYATTLNNLDFIDDDPNTIPSAGRMDVLYLTLGIRTEFFSVWDLTAAVVLPLRDDNDKLFDAEVAIQFVRLL